MAEELGIKAGRTLSKKEKSPRASRLRRQKLCGGVIEKLPGKRPCGSVLKANAHRGV
jgi:hypothetical protein